MALPVRLDELVETVSGLSDSEKDKFFANFCRVCHEKIEFRDWAGENYLYVTFAPP